MSNFCFSTLQISPPKSRATTEITESMITSSDNDDDKGGSHNQTKQKINVKGEGKGSFFNSARHRMKSRTLGQK